MDFDLTPEQMAVRSMAREWALAEVAPVIQRYDEAHEFPRELIVSLAKTGLLGALVPRSTAGLLSTTSPTPSPWKSSTASTPPWGSRCGRTTRSAPITSLSSAPQRRRRPICRVWPAGNLWGHGG